MDDLISRKDILDALSVLNDNQYGNIHFRNGIANAMSIVEDAPSVETTVDWISVKDRLPETIPCNAGTACSEAVCVLTAERCVCTALWNGETWIGDFDYWEADWRTVTHWKPVIPLPVAEGRRNKMTNGDKIRSMTLTDYEKEILELFDGAALKLSSEDYEKLCNYTKLVMEGDI